MVNWKGDLVSRRHTEDFLSDPQTPASWRCTSMSNGTLGDLAPHMINAALALMGPIRSLMCEYETVHEKRPGGHVVTMIMLTMCRFDSGLWGTCILVEKRLVEKWDMLTKSMELKDLFVSIKKIRIQQVISIRRTRSYRGFNRF